MFIRYKNINITVKTTYKISRDVFKEVMHNYISLLRNTIFIMYLNVNEIFTRNKIRRAVAYPKKVKKKTLLLKENPKTIKIN